MCTIHNILCISMCYVPFISLHARTGACQQSRGVSVTFFPRPARVRRKAESFITRALSYKKGDEQNLLIPGPFIRDITDSFISYNECRISAMAASAYSESDLLDQIFSEQRICSPAKSPESGSFFLRR